MALVEYAEKELREAGLFDKDSDYSGGIARSVMELVKVFAAQGHSGMSAQATLSVFNRVASYKPLGALKNPTVTGEYIVVDSGPTPVWQSTRRSSVFSEDGGKTWYDIDRQVPWLKRIFGVRRAQLSFAKGGVWPN